MVCKCRTKAEQQPWNGSNKRVNEWRCGGIGGHRRWRRVASIEAKNRPVTGLSWWYRWRDKKDMSHQEQKRGLGNPAVLSIKIQGLCKKGTLRVLIVNGHMEKPSLGYQGFFFIFCFFSDFLKDFSVRVFDVRKPKKPNQTSSMDKKLALTSISGFHQQLS